MKIRKRSRFAAEVSTHSLNDIMFFLLLFFLIVSTMANPNVIRLMLPKASATDKYNRSQIVLSVNKEREFFIDKKPISAAALEQELSALAGNVDEDKRPVILIRADKELQIQDLVDIMTIGVKLKLKMVLGADKSAG